MDPLVLLYAMQHSLAGDKKINEFITFIMAAVLRLRKTRLGVK